MDAEREGDRDSIATRLIARKMRQTQLIAPCGINCGVCFAHLRSRNPCPGCRGPDVGKPVTRVRCIMKKCERSGMGGGKFCFRCHEFPCESLLRLDRRYRARYHMSPIDNLRRIDEDGITKFLDSERKQWTCSACGGTVCVHKAICMTCRKHIDPALHQKLFQAREVNEGD